MGGGFLTEGSRNMVLDRGFLTYTEHDTGGLISLRNHLVIYIYTLKTYKFGRDPGPFPLPLGPSPNSQFSFFLKLPKSFIVNKNGPFLHSLFSKPSLHYKMVC